MTNNVCITKEELAEHGRRIRATVDSDINLLISGFEERDKKRRKTFGMIIGISASAVCLFLGGLSAVVIDNVRSISRVEDAHQRIVTIDSFARMEETVKYMSNTLTALVVRIDRHMEKSEQRLDALEQSQTRTEQTFKGMQ